MKPYSNNKRILLIDHHEYWQEFSSSILRSAGFLVCTLDTYNYFIPQDCLQGENPDLVILSCNHIGPEEEYLIARLLAHKHHLLVLCDFIPWQKMRFLFLQGVNDITDKPYDPAYLIALVDEVLASLVPRNSYQAVEREGVA